jgi:WD40 repeat protein
MPSKLTFTTVGLVLLAAASVAAQDAAKPAAPPKITYDDHVRAIFREHCFSCHSADKQESGLALDSYQKAMAGGSSGEVVLAGDLASSRLWALVSHAEEPKMPPRQDKLAAAKLELISKWIEGGAPENAGSKVVVKKNPLAALSASSAAKPEGQAVMPVSVVKQPVLYTKRPGQITALATSPFAPLVAIAGQRQITLYNTDTGELLGVLPFAEGIPQVLRFSRNGTLLLAGGGRAGHSGCVVLYDVKTGKRLTKLGDELDAVLSADINSAQTLVALGGPSRVVRIYSVETGEQVHEIRKHTDWIYAVEFSPDGKLLTTADRSGGLFVWEGDTAREVQFLRGHTGGVFDVAWRADSGVLASAGEDATVKLWDVNEGKALKSWSAHAGGAFCVRFAPDGSVVSAGRDKTVKTWAADGAAQKTMPAFAEQALKCAFSHDGKLVLGGDWLGNVRIFMAADAKPVRDLDANPGTIAVRLAKAEADLAAAQKSSSAAASVLKDAEQTAAKFQKSLEVAEATKKAIAAAQAALNQAPKDGAPAMLGPETLKPALDSLTAAAKATDEAIQKLTAEGKAAQELLAKHRKAATDAQAAIDSASRQIAAAKADQEVFESYAAQLAAAVQEAQAALDAFNAAYSRDKQQVTSAK